MLPGQHIARLRERGMAVDENLARQWLANVSYYRLSAYWYPAWAVNDLGDRMDTFVHGASFTDAIQLYEADRKLRTLVHDGMERIEITLRTRIGELLCARDPLEYTDSRRFRPAFKHNDWMNIARKRIARAGRRNEAINHYREKYGGRYPFWVLAEVLDFADISRLFEGLTAFDQRTIAEGLGISVSLSALSKNQQRKVRKESPLVPWLEQLTIVRNTCAHHGRLWNKSFAPAPTPALRTLPEFTELPEFQSERIFGTLTLMANILRVASPGSPWANRVAELISGTFLANPMVSPESLGLPADWSGTI